MIKELKIGAVNNAEFGDRAAKAAAEIYPKSVNKIWWEPLPIVNYTLESFTKTDTFEPIHSAEIYRNIWNDNRYARIYLPPDLEKGFVPTVIIGKAEDVYKYAIWDQVVAKNFDGSNAIDPELGINLSNEDLARIPDIGKIFKNGQTKYFGRKSSFVLTRRIEPKGKKLVYKIFENLVRPKKNESFVHIMNSDESPFSTSVGGVMITNSEEYVQKTMAKR